MLSTVVSLHERDVVVCFLLSVYYPSVADVNQSLVDDGLVDKEKISGSNYYWSFPAKKDRQQQIQHDATVQEIEKIKATLPGIETAVMDAKRGREEEVEVVVVLAADDVVVVSEKPDESKPTAAATASADMALLQSTGELVSEAAATTTTTTEALPPASKKFKSTGRAATLERLAVLAREKAAGEAEAATLKENDPQALADLEREVLLTTQAANRWTDNIFNCKSYLVKKRGMDKKEACKIIGITSAFDCTSRLGLLWRNFCPARLLLQMTLAWS